MIAYLDTSSLVKLFCDEVGSGQVRSLLASASLVATSVVAYPEARSAFARQHREGRISTNALDKIKRAIEADWPRFFRLEVGERVWRLAGDLAEEFSLRGFDSLHLASFAILRDSSPGDLVMFSCFDKRLQSAAQELSLR